MRDLVGHAAPPLALEVVRASWPRHRDALAYLFGTGAVENRVRAPGSDREVVYPLESRGRARFDHHRALALAGGAFEAQGAGKAFARACRRAKGITIEALIRPGNILRGTDGQILMLQNEEGRFILQLFQKDGAVRTRLRTDDDDPEVAVATLSSTNPFHLVVSDRSGGRLVAYVDGNKVVDSDRVSGDLEKLDEASLLLFGDDAEGKNDWDGSLEGVALYCRFMDEAEAADNAHAYLARVEGREEVPRHRIRARLLSVSDAPTLDEIAPYREGLTVYEWEVLREEQGELGEERVRVAHWAVLGGATQPIASLRPGKRRWLDLEPFEDNPQVDELVLADDLELAPDLPLLLDVGP